ncbi:hypothetical protein [Aquimarina brevivitae]|uniref:Uncharacterized protein n=1 Tax=Aquimarina brevivitae TaxID=323412 RepID=A0A4Q7NTG9_9FLAO|nr:hypothetical protein [Aquimarina brevivitae]RZS90441.1 hypothetical protein EV197_3426 [Aquimarina brevivitae]
MNRNQLVKILRILFIVTGAGLLVYELAKPSKNYYFQAIGLSLLMIGLFLVNISIPHKNQDDNQSNSEE